VAILHRPDTKHLPIPSLSEVFPDKFIDGALFEKAKEESNIVPEKERVLNILYSALFRKLTLYY
jgi:hypothetical protein